MRFQARAAAEVAEIDAWWRTHRDAGNLFASELAETLAVLAKAPDIGATGHDPALASVGRVLLRKTQYHVYFRVVADALEVLAVWHAKRQPPTL